ncbi:MAG: MerR family transcriptional regulator [Bacteroidia bacterium]|nr:MerR family transcriptional regulator [Bacteroidia bacterium]NNJ55205.1 MerR family transcriptional regulator [Bacteroidia bacterium]
MTQRLSIRDLENLSGIKAHTIRIWEKRYELFDPLRTPTNIRTYDSSDLKKLLNIVSVLKSGMKIGKATSLTDEELCDEIEFIATTNSETSNEILINDFLISTLKCDISLFEELYSKSVSLIGIEKTIEDILYPLLVKIGMLWTVSKLQPAQEHFTSQMIRQKLFSAIDALPQPRSDERYLLFLPEGENHEIGMLYGYYLIKKSGRECLYLGPSVPIKGVLESVKNASSTHIVIQFITSRTNDTINNYLIDVSELFHSQKVYLSGVGIDQIPETKHNNLRLLSGLKDLRKLL